MSTIPVIIQRSEVAKMLATSERHVRRLVEEGKLKAIKIGGKQRFVLSDVEAFIERSIIESGAKES